jgi:hypothetical protein
MSERRHTARFECSSRGLRKAARSVLAAMFGAPQLPHAGFPFLAFYPLAVASVSSSFFVCADSAGIRARRASSASRK